MSISLTIIKDAVRNTQQVLAAHSLELKDLKESLLYTNKTLREIKEILKRKK